MSDYRICTQKISNYAVYGMFKTGDDLTALTQCLYLYNERISKLEATSMGSWDSSQLNSNGFVSYPGNFNVPVLTINLKAGWLGIVYPKPAPKLQSVCPIDRGEISTSSTAIIKVS